jgi:hypothetical protein
VAIALGVLVEIPAGYLPWLGGFSSTLDGLLWVYAFGYVWIAMLRYYQQGGVLTTIKFVTLGVAYSLLLGVTLVATLILNAVLT